MTFGVFEEIERLIEYIPIECDNLQIDGKIANGTSLDSKFYFEDIDGVATRLGIIEVVPGEAQEMRGESRFNTLVSVRDIVRLLNKFLKDARIEEVTLNQRYKQLQLIKGFDSFLRNLLFDFCLAALDGDNLNAKLYLRHSYYLLGLHRRLTLLLSVIVNEPSLKEDKDIRQLLTLLAVMTEPNNIDVYFDPNDTGFNKKYTTYLKELQKLTPDHKEITSNPQKKEETEEEATSRANRP
ncbi:MAG: hypothetical protein WAM14_02195 [Candidatus Nitrosopolaris sp.]